MKKLLTLVLLLAALTFTTQTAWAANDELNTRLAVTQNQGTLGGSFKIQIKLDAANVTSTDGKLGTTTIKLNFNTVGLSLVGGTFNSPFSTSDYTGQSITDNSGVVTVTLTLNGSAATLSTSQGSPTDLAEIVFNINDPNELSGITWNSSGASSLDGTGLASYNLIGDNTNGNVALPVELTAFDASWLGESAYLTFSTASEHNNNRFEIERSLDGQWWGKEPIGIVLGAGTTQTPRDYTFIDPKTPQANIVYYRLKQVDDNGQFEYSNIVPLRKGGYNDMNPRVEMYPNPFRGSSYLTIRTHYEKSKVEITNLFGQTVATSNDGRDLIPLQSLPAGFYTVYITSTDGTVNSERLVIQQ